MRPTTSGGRTIPFSSPLILPFQFTAKSIKGENPKRGERTAGGIFAARAAVNAAHCQSAPRPIVGVEHRLRSLGQGQHFVDIAFRLSPIESEVGKGKNFMYAEEILPFQAQIPPQMEIC